MNNNDDQQNGTIVAARLISAAIIVFAAAVLLVGGAFVKHADTQMFLYLVGCVVGLAGLFGWFASFKGR